MIIELDLRRDLTEAAIHEARQNPGHCYYSAPCIVGAMRSADQRDFLREVGLNGKFVRDLIEAGDLVVPVAQQPDFERLQSAFDSNLDEFDRVLAGIVARYRS